MTTQHRLFALGITTLVFSLACGAVTSLVPTPAPTARPTTDVITRQLQVFDAVWNAVNDKYVRADFDGVDWKAVGDEYRAQVAAGLDEAAFTRAVHAMLAELPAGQAAYQTRAERLEAETRDTSSYEGIGAFIAFRLEPQPHVVILAVMEDSPAEKAGLEAHDSIYAIDGEPVRADEADTVSNRIRGPADSSVTLTVQGPTGSRRSLTIPRGQVTVSDALRGGELSDLQLVVYRLPVLSDPQMASTIAEHLLTVSSQNTTRGVVLDLRVAHSGGPEWPLDGLLTVFGNGRLGETYDRNRTQPVEITGRDFGGSQTVPLVILVGPDTQGLPEIFAGALRDAGRAVLIGLPTPGAIQGFEEIPLPDGSRLFLATSSFRTSTGTDFAANGLEPDIRVDSDWDAVTSTDDPVLEAAVEYLTRP